MGNADPHNGHGHHPGPEQAKHDRPHAGHDKHAGHSPAMFRDRFWLSLLMTVPVVYWSAHVQGLLGDRKSTRLNSSHVKISYAVFCLKKKKTINATLTRKNTNAGRRKAHHIAL